MSQNGITGRNEDQYAEITTGPSVVGRHKNTRVYLYDFASMGGDVGSVFLRGAPLPKGAVVTNAYMDVITAPTSAGSTAEIAVTVESAGDVQTAAAVSGAPWSTTGLKDVVAPEPGTESGYIKTTAARTPSVAITVEALTDGKFYVVCEYDVTE